MVVTDSSLTSSFLHKITHTISFTVAYLLMMLWWWLLYIYIYIYIYIMYKYVYWYIGTICLSYYSCCFLSCRMYIVCCIQLIIYCIVEWWERYEILASLLLLLLLLLVVIYDGVVMYSETIVMDWYVDDDDIGLCQQTCWVFYHVRAHSFPQGSFPTRIITIFSFQVIANLWYIYIYIWVQFVCDTI